MVQPIPLIPDTFRRRSFWKKQWPAATSLRWHVWGSSTEMGKALQRMKRRLRNCLPHPFLHRSCTATLQDLHTFVRPSNLNQSRTWKRKWSELKCSSALIRGARLYSPGRLQSSLSPNSESRAASTRLSTKGQQKR